MANVGGCGYFIERHVVCGHSWRSTFWNQGRQHMGESYDICVLELWAVHRALRLIAAAPQELLGDVDIIYIISDNKPVVEWVAGLTAARHACVHRILILIDRDIRKLDTEHAAPCAIQWCRRGHWFGNQMADALAKLAVKHAVPADCVT